MKCLHRPKSSLDRLYGALRKLVGVKVPEQIGEQVPPAFLSALLDDINTPKALAETICFVKAGKYCHQNGRKNID